MKKITLIACCFILVFSCARKTIKTPEQAMRAVDYQKVLVDDLPIEQFQIGLKEHINRLEKRGKRFLTFGNKRIAADEYKSSLTPLLTITTKEKLLEYIEEHFELMEVYGRDDWSEIMLTSYYSPLYPARKSPTSKYYQPIYRLPTDLVEISVKKFSSSDLGSMQASRNNISARVSKDTPLPFARIVPYYNRDQIDNKKVLKGRGLELYYMDPIHAFFLQIQGSGELELADGTRVQVGYAGKNGWKYESIGKFLYHVIPKEEMSLQKIEEYLRSLEKKELYQFLNKNPSYVFFRKLSSKGRTTFGTEVVAGRTLAIDNSLFPLGAMAFLSFQKPFFTDKSSTEPDGFRTTSRLVLAQDTGGAIKTPGRADLYWGEGDEALRYAGVMRHKANLWFLFPKEK